MDICDVKESVLQLPKGARMPRNQVAGHIHESRTKLGFLIHDDGSILKPLQKPERGMKELNFYRRVFDPDCADDTILQLQRFLPRFYGSYHFQEYDEVTYIKMENTVSRFRRPCVLDIKMGQRMYDPEADQETIVKRTRKFPHAEKCGFQLTGMQVYNPREGKMDYYDKLYCRKIGKRNMLRNGLGSYFDVNHGLRKDAIQVILQKLCEIEQWFKTQRKFSFYASSLLLVYEGDTQNYDRPIFPCVGCDTKDTDTTSDRRTNTIVDMSTYSNSSIDSPHCNSNGIHECIDESIADVRMIDFTHVFNDTQQDDNYLYGLQNLIEYMHQLLEINCTK